MAVFRLLMFMVLATPFVACIGSARSADEPSEKPKAEKPADLTPQERLDEIVSEYGREYSKLRTKMYSSKEADVREEVTKEIGELRETYAKKARAIAEEDPKTPLALKALKTILYPIRATSEETQQWVKERLLDDYINDKALVPVIAIVAQDKEFIDELFEKTESRDVRGVILYYRMLGAKGRELTEEKEPEVRPMMERICKEFHDVELVYPGGRVRGLIGELVENELFAYENLRIGKVAPELEGSDVHGKALRLSDFRGKVVVLDFWGDW